MYQFLEFSSVLVLHHWVLFYCPSQLEGGGGDKGRCVPVFLSLSIKFCVLWVCECVCFALMCCCLCLGVFHFPPMCCLCLWSTGPPLHCSSASSSPVEQLPFPPPSIAANESKGGLLGNSAAQPAQDSDSEDEFGPNSFLVKTGSGNLYAPATATADGESLFKLLLLCGGWLCSVSWTCLFCVLGLSDTYRICPFIFLFFFHWVIWKSWTCESIFSLRKCTEPCEPRVQSLLRGMEVSGSAGDVLSQTFLFSWSVCRWESSPRPPL